MTTTDSLWDGSVKARVLIVGSQGDPFEQASTALDQAGFEISAATSGADALRLVADDMPDIMVVAGALASEMPGIELVSRLRSGPWHSLPLVVVGSHGPDHGAVEALAAGADDYLPATFSAPELVARVQAKLSRPPAPPRLLRATRAAVAEDRLMDDAEREMRRAVTSRRSGVLIAVQLAEMPILRRRLGVQAEHEVAATFAELFSLDALPLEEHCVRRTGSGFLLMLPETGEAAAVQRLRRLSERVALTVLDIGGEQVRVTPVIGYASFGAAGSADELRADAVMAMEEAGRHLDLVPVAFTPSLAAAHPAPSTGVAARIGRLWNRLRAPLEVTFTFGLALIVPFTVYLAAGQIGIDLTVLTYPLVVAALVGTAAVLWLEGFVALRPAIPADEPARPYPPATALIAAYLPNEAATIIDTLSTFLRQDYPGELQILLAYNAPQHLPVEDRLIEMAAAHPRLELLRVETSTSKAQNINAALAYVTGEFVGIFDADHHPEPGSFARAWRWLAQDYDVVQGHCVVRNGEASWVSRLVAVEFETIYAVSHPGRARLHGFGIFGGSNGYWRFDALRRIRMHGSMLTEDIDSSMRGLLDGLHIVSDPGLTSTELATTTIGALWNQRMRWAQGWAQNAQRHLRPMLRSDELTRRQKVGASFLLGWTQVAPWITVQVLPILAFAAWRQGGIGHVALLVPLFVALTVFTLSSGLAQTLFAYRLGNRSIRRHRAWFFVYALNAALWYGEFKNMIVRVSQLKEFVGDRQWKVTPRMATPADQPARGFLSEDRPALDTKVA
jgi:cellulose synthase/poly-beta-1,6-N-acetylglucosamine synthase-like glycosyltransferase/DNA-binding response OmpR family regulator